MSDAPSADTLLRDFNSSKITLMAGVVVSSNWPLFRLQTKTPRKTSAIVILMDMSNVIMAMLVEIKFTGYELHSQRAEAHYADAADWHNDGRNQRCEMPRCCH